MSRRARRPPSVALGAQTVTRLLEVRVPHAAELFLQKHPLA